MKQSLIWIATLFLMTGTFTANAQGGDDPVLMTVDGQDILKSEFEYMFKKNNREEEITKEVLDEYLDLYVKFRLKVRAAEALGMDTVDKFQKELAGYRSQISRTYLTDHEMNDELLNEAYERSTEEVRASHILLKLDMGASPEDTAAVYQRIMTLRQRLLNGEDFEKVAKGKDGSEDPSVQQNGGDLGYFKALEMVYPFENAAFKTPVGQVSMPVRTRYGYHLLKVFDRRKARGQIRVAHIMVATTDKDIDTKRESAKSKIDEIYQSLLKGEDFKSLAQRHSDDKTSAQKGGELPWFGTGRMVEEFENAAFSLEKDGDISKPVQSSYGWHIIKRIETKGVPAFEEMKASLKTRIARDTRSQKTRASFISKLKKEYGYVDYPKSFKHLYKQMDTTIFYGDWKPTKAKKLAKKVAYEFNGETFTLMDFADHLMANQQKEKDTKQDLQMFTDKKFRQHINEMIMSFEDKRLEEKYPEFRLLMKEYRDGILLFELTDDMVWSKAVRDTSGLDAFHKANASKYMWGERTEATVYFCADKKVAKRVRYLLKKKKGNGEIVKEINADSELNLKIDTDKFSKGDSEVVDGFERKVGLTEDKEVNGQVVFMDIINLLPAEPKALDEARGLITSEYQIWLEEEWIKELRDLYKVNVNKDVLYSIK